MDGVEHKTVKLISSLGFIPNHGQIDKKAKFYLRGSNVQVYFTEEDFRIVLFENKPRKSFINSLNKRILGENAEKLKGYVVMVQFVEPNLKLKLTCQKQKQQKLNFLYGNDQKRWNTNVSTFEELIYQNLWENIDLVFHQEKGELKYEFIVKPGGDPENIRLNYTGAKNLVIDQAGNLTMDTPLGTLVDKAPKSFQLINGQIMNVKSHFEIKEPDINTITYTVDESYFKETDLVIDPGIVFSTLLGGNTTDNAYSIALDANNDVYVTGNTLSSDFPTLNGFDRTINGNFDAFVTKIRSDGSGIIYSTFLGGSAGDSGFGIAVDSKGSAYVTGQTQSDNFPTINSFDNIFNGSDDAFVTKLSADGGGIVYSTFLGGSGADIGWGIAVDADGNAYVTGQTGSSNFPTPNGFDTTYNGGLEDAFVTKINEDGSAIVFSTYLGGSEADFGYDIALDENRNVYVTGRTQSANFPTLNGFDPTYNGEGDAFVTKIRADGSGIVYSTFLGGAGDDGAEAIAVDANGNAYVTGITHSTDFPVVNGFDTTLNGPTDAFVTKISAAGNEIVYSSYLGGSSDDFGRGIAVDVIGNAYVAGYTSSSDFPTPNGFDPTFNGEIDSFVTKISPDGSGIIYSTYLGGSEDDLARDLAINLIGNAYVTGQTFSPNFPTLNAFDSTLKGLTDAFITKIDLTAQAGFPVTEADLAVTKTDYPDPVYAGDGLTYTLTILNNGPETAKNVIVFDKLPDTVSLISSTPSQGRRNYANGVLAFNLGELVSGASAKIEIHVIPEEEGIIENVALVLGYVEDPNINNNIARERTRVLGEMEE